MICGISLGYWRYPQFVINRSIDIITQAIVSHYFYELYAVCGYVHPELIRLCEWISSIKTHICLHRCTCVHTRRVVVSIKRVDFFFQIICYWCCSRNYYYYDHYYYHHLFVFQHFSRHHLYQIGGSEIIYSEYAGLIWDIDIQQVYLICLCS